MRTAPREPWEPVAPLTPPVAAGSHGLLGDARRAGPVHIVAWQILPGDDGGDVLGAHAVAGKMKAARYYTPGVAGQPGRLPGGLGIWRCTAR
jgi:hypothetical protein